MKTKLTALISLAALSLTVGACSNTDPVDTTQTSSTGYDISQVTTDESLAALLPQKYKDSGTLNVATSADYEPAEFMDVDGKTPIGYDMDVIKSVAKKLGLKTTITHAPFDSIIPAVGSKYDVAIASFEMNKERMAESNMVGYMESGSIYLIQKDNPKKFDSANLCGAQIGVQSGTAQQSNVEEWSKKCTADGKEAISILPETDAQMLFTKVQGGQMDAALIDNIAAALAAKKNPDTLTTFGDVINPFPVGMVLGKNDNELAEAVAKATQALLDDGTISGILKEWNVDQSSMIKKTAVNQLPNN